MNFFIISFVVLSLVGSIMWVMPTKRDRFLATLRLEAKRLGFQVQLTKLTYPREKGEIEARRVSSVVYRLLRGTITQPEHQNWVSWRVVRCETNACEGLTAGWGWVVGERELSVAQLERVNELLISMPIGIIGLESTPIHVSAFWMESENELLEVIKKPLERLIEMKI
ncbi:MAG: hypothetical protein ACI9ES_002284 [Oceanospirillaceae bacterium]|jgi:hypothetical protein